MVGMNQIRGIIFDMDNTILQSKIQFAAMKSDIYQYLRRENVLPDEFPIHNHTTSTIIEHARQRGISEQTYESIMDIAAKHELEGMEGAGLEPGARELLDTLVRDYLLIIVTNNSINAASRALELTEVIDYFDLVIGREKMSSLKPSPSGFQYVLHRYGHIPPDEWISIGDSWIDGRASLDAGIPFISYQTDEAVMRDQGVEPVGQVNHLLDMLQYMK